MTTTIETTTQAHLTKAQELDLLRLANALKIGGESLRRMAESGTIDEVLALAATDRLGHLAIEALKRGALPEASIVLRWWRGDDDAVAELYPRVGIDIAQAHYSVLGVIAGVIFPAGLVPWTEVANLTVARYGTDDAGSKSYRKVGQLQRLFRCADAADAVAESLRSMQASNETVFGSVGNRPGTKAVGDSFVSVRELAEMYPTMSRDAIRKRLERTRKKDPASFQEISNPGSGGPRFLYRLSTARDRLES